MGKFLVDFTYVVMILISLFRGWELPIYPEVRGVCPKPLTNAALRKEYVGWLESLRRVQH